MPGIQPSAPAAIVGDVKPISRLPCDLNLSCYQKADKEFNVCFQSKQLDLSSNRERKIKFLKLTKTIEQDSQHSELQQNCWLGWKTKKKSNQNPQNQKSVARFSLQDTHLHILECQVLSATPSIDRKPGSSTCHHTEDPHNSFHSRIYVQVDVVAEKNSRTSDSASTIWLYKTEKTTKIPPIKWNFKSAKNLRPGRKKLRKE